MFCLCVFTTLTNDTKQLKKNSQTNFDTLNTQKEKLDDAKKRSSAEEKRETKRKTLTPITTLSSQNMTATMDVDSDDDDEIIAERGTIAHILIFSRRARVCSSSFSLITFDDRRKERRRSFLRAKTTDTNTFGRNEIRTLSSELEGTLRITR